ncbi:MAG: hypothetical protein WCX61_03060 [Candidatus Peribacteraceae bacterium]
MPESLSPSESRERGPVSSFDKEFEQFESLLGEEPPVPVPGQWEHKITGGGPGFEEGTLSIKDIYSRMEQLATKGLENFWDLEEWNQEDLRARKLQAWNAMQQSGDQNGREKSRQEFLLTNEALTYHAYLPQTLTFLRWTLLQYRGLRQRWEHYNPGPVPSEYDRLEQFAGEYLAKLNQALRDRLAFARAIQFQGMIDLQANLPVLEGRLQSLESQKDADPGEVTRLKHLVAVANALHIQTQNPDELRQKAEEALATLDVPEEIKNQIRASGGGSKEVRELKNRYDAHIVNLLTGKSQFTGLSEDVLPQMMYVRLWKDFNAELRDVQENVTRDLARNPKKSVEDLKDYIVGLRAEHIQGGVDFVHGLGEQELLLEEIARLRNQFGPSLDGEGVSAQPVSLSPKEAKELQEWLEKRADFRLQQVREALDGADKMLDISITQEIEDNWNKRGKPVVTNIIEHLARAATSPLPSKDNTNISARAYRTLAKIIDLPESEEEQHEKLSGQIQEALGWSKGKTWDELTDAEKSKILEQCKSVVDAKKNFDRSSIAHLKQTMDLVEKLPPSEESAGAVIDMEEIRRIEEAIARGDVRTLPKKRIDRDIVGMVIEGQVIDPAKATVLLIRQRDKEWGDPEQRSGFMGEYAQYMQALEENVQGNFAFSQALLEAEQAWRQYAYDVAKMTAVPVAAAALWPLIVAGGSLALQGTYLVGKGAYKMARGGGKLLRAPRVASGTAEQLTRLRYLAWERRITQALETTRAGKMIAKLNALRNLRVARVTGTTLKVAGWAAIPAIAVYENHLNNQRIKAAEGNAALQTEYRSQNTATWLEAGGVAAAFAVPGVLASGILAAPVWWAREYNGERSEYKAGWDRTVADMVRENDSANLRERLFQKAPGKEAESGGGGAYRTRVGSWVRSKEDQEEAIASVAGGNRGERGRVYEAYFWENLAVPEDMPDSTKRNILLDKLAYVQAATHGGMEAVPNTVLEQADICAQLIQTWKELQRTGQPEVISYFDDKGERKWLDLRDLAATDFSKMNGVVTDYMTHVQPVQELLLFNALGDTARDHKRESIRKAEWKKAREHVRSVLLSKLIHPLHDIERHIRKIDWDGMDIWPVSSGQMHAENLIRAAIARDIESDVDYTVNELLYGRLTQEQYEEFLKRCRSRFAELRDATSTSEKVSAYQEAAEQRLRDADVDLDAIMEADRKENPLYQLFPHAEE